MFVTKRKTRNIKNEYMKTFLLKTSLFFFYLLLLASSISAQEKDSVDYRKHVLRTSIPTDWYGNFTPQIAYERYLENKSTLVLRMDLYFYNNYEIRFYEPDFSFTRTDDIQCTVDGIEVMAFVQYRYYISRIKKVFPRGFYTGGFASFQYLNEYSEIVYKMNSLESNENRNINSGYLGVGPIIGYQFSLFDKISIDINLSGLYSKNVFRFEDPAFIRKPSEFTLNLFLSFGYAFGSK
jgi:hypothetical protein